MEVNSTQAIHEQISHFIKGKLPGKQGDKLAVFSRDYFKSVSAEDIAQRVPEDLYGCVLSHWNQLLNYVPGTAITRVYNPTLEDHGWQSRHTIVEIVVDDMPFLVRSITMEINRHGFANHLVIHPVLYVQRNGSGELLSTSDAAVAGGSAESLILVEIDRQISTEVIHQLQQDLARILTDVRAATQDWRPCLKKMASVIDALKASDPAYKNEANGLSDGIAFLQWLHDEHFVFLGYREYQLIKQDGQAGFKATPGSGLGILRDTISPLGEDSAPVLLSDDAYQAISDATPVIITKATSKSTVHRPVFMDYIGIKQFDAQGGVCGEIRFLGLYSSSAYSCDIKQIPVVSCKIESIIARSNFQTNSHDARALLFVLQSLPRDELFQAEENSLFDCAMGILQLQERQRVRVFVRHDVYGHFISLLVFVPRERYHTDSRKKIEKILLAILHGQNVDFRVQLSESILARIHFIIHSTESCCIDYSVKDIEEKIVAALAEWKDELKLELNNYFGEARGNEFFQQYSNGFSAAYRDDFPPRCALLDLKNLERLEQSPEKPQCVLFSPLTAIEKKQLRFKLFCSGQKASLSKCLPMLENMGVKVEDERPYEINKSGLSSAFWMHDFGLSYKDTAKLNLARLKRRFQDAFEQCWKGYTENDGFNQLIIEAELTWQQVNIFRALYFYLRQIDITFSEAYVESTLASNPSVVKLLIKLFAAKFDPALQKNAQLVTQLQEQTEQAIDRVSSLDEDRILRRFLNVIVAAVRTNYFKNPLDEQGIPYFSIKLNSAQIYQLPAPVPYFEIFVYSPRTEGIHLRGGAVARGGLRWSDRREDFRTEVLGLMKAQMTKNSVIVPTGAKGGFVVKNQYQLSSESQLHQEVICCYRILIRGLLDVTDNLQGNEVVKPADVIYYDDDDPYLVVAADKGTAAFSDFANELSKDYTFWLGDAFASGGSAGYDHKAMGITARGAWESVKHHFNVLSIAYQTTPFSVIGIGSMAGDVFGNGMLLSDKIKLVAAFDHESIFLDPNPAPDLSFQERKRLFLLPKSSWRDYDSNLITKGGGVFSRQAKSIALSEEVKTILDINADHLTPNNLIQALLCAPVDLLWNGGIGTYVKASDELNVTVGDKANDTLRVNARQLRCKVVGEGGNLGFTQLGRIEYAASGGKINTDAIDNSAGVDCSDHEVNIKICLDSLVRQGDLTNKQRNSLLEQMTDQVAELVLRHNYLQNRVITMVATESCTELGVIQRLIDVLDSQGYLDRELECIPDNEVLEERRAAGKGLTRPEISVLLAYSKKVFKEMLLAEPESLDVELVKRELLLYFPSQLQEKFPEAIQKHRLCREIVVNQLVNSLVNRLGMVYPYRLVDELGYSPAAVVNAYILVCKVFDLETLWYMLEQHEGRLEHGLLAESKLMARKTIERSMNWFLHYALQAIIQPETEKMYASGINELAPVLIGLLSEQDRLRLDTEVDRLIQGGIAADLALKLAMFDVLFLCLDVIDIRNRYDFNLQDVASVFFHVLDLLNLSWMRQQIAALPKDNIWELQARYALMEEYNALLCALVIDVLQRDAQNVDAKIAVWLASGEQEITKYRQLMKLIKTEKQVDLEKITVVLKELRNIRTDK